MSAPGRTPPALVASTALGAVGAVLLVVGAALGGDAFFVAAVAAGALSLGAALYWRAQLISSWRRGRPGPD